MFILSSVNWVALILVELFDYPILVARTKGELMAKICNNDSKHSLLRLTLTIEAKCDTTWERSDRINLDRV